MEYLNPSGHMNIPTDKCPGILSAGSQGISCQGVSSQGVSSQGVSSQGVSSQGISSSLPSGFTNDGGEEAAQPQP